MSTVISTPTKKSPRSTASPTARKKKPASSALTADHMPPKKTAQDTQQDISQPHTVPELSSPSPTPEAVTPDLQQDSPAPSEVKDEDTATAKDTEQLSTSLDLSKYEPPAPQSRPGSSLLERLNLKLRPETLARLAELRAMAAEAEPERPARGNWAPLYPVYARLRANGYSREDALSWLVQQGAVAPENRTKALNALKTLAVRRGKPAP